MLLADVASCSLAVAATSSRREKAALIATTLAQAGPEDARIAVRYLTGEPPQKRLGITWTSLAGPWVPAALPTLTLVATDVALSEIEAVSGPGAVEERTRRLTRLMSEASSAEQTFLQRLLAGELRQGALQGVVTEAVAAAAGVTLPALRRAAMVAGDLAEVAAVALVDGEVGLDRFRLRVGYPLQPMLAKSATSIEVALERVGPAVVEWKLDGVRVQVHRAGDQVSVFTRTLEPIAPRLPEVVEKVLALPGDRLILDGEVIALRPNGRPRPFQETSARVAFRGDPDALRETVPLSPFFFDLLHLDGQDLIDLPLRERIALADRLLPSELAVPRLLQPGEESARTFMADALARGHEGVLVKGLESAYQAGRRGDGWVKVKPRHTLDLVVLAAEWGHGRRQGLLSNLHLGARDPSGGFVMLGKTFKGLTDEVLRWQTQALLELEVGRRGIAVLVNPELVVEVAFDGIQTSPRYPGGVALRFARVLRYRDDKGPADADTIETVRELGGG
ncbi:MAG TPA: ATP-dependent DNA ligase [Candidatus Dormibacteraeota bacterium]